MGKEASKSNLTEGTAQWSKAGLFVSSNRQEDDIGRRVAKANADTYGNSPSFGRRIWVVILTMFLAFIVFHATVFVVLECVVYRFFPDYNKEKRFDELESPYDDIKRDNVPDVHEWYRTLDPATSLLPLPRDISETAEGGECLEKWFSAAEGAVPYTAPSVIELVLLYYGISTRPLVRNALKDFLAEPQPVSAILKQSAQCMQTSVPMARLCSIMDQGLMKPDFNNTQQKHALEYTMNLYVVLEFLTMAATDNLALLSELVEAMKARRPSREKEFKEVYGPAHAAFLQDKYEGMVVKFDSLHKALAQNSPLPNVELLQFNILEATKLDIVLGHEANARVGLALAAAVTFGSSIEDHTLSMRLGKDWTDAYVAWNTAFVVSSVPIYALGKLFMPMVSCAASQTTQGEGFLSPRITSLSITLMHSSVPVDASSLGIDTQKLKDMQDYVESETAGGKANGLARFALSEEMGASNLHHTMLPSPFHDQVEEMFYKLCGQDCHDGSWAITDTSLESLLDDEDFNIYVGIILWLTVLLAGLGLELVFWFKMCHEGWSEQQESRWWFAQLLFPLLAATCLGLATHLNFMALPFLVLGLWKFGMPETLSFMYLALYDANKSKFAHVANFVNAIGTILHHSAATITIVMMLAGVFPGNRYVLDPILVLLVQHWFVMLKYVNFWWYTGIELVLEIWFEWKVFSNFQYLHSLHWTAAFAALGMLAAHWLYLFAAASELGLAFTRKTEFQDETDEVGNEEDNMIGVAQRRSTISSQNRSSRRLLLDRTSSVRRVSLLQHPTGRRDEVGNEEDTMIGGSATRRSSRRLPMDRSSSVRAGDQRSSMLSVLGGGYEDALSEDDEKDANKGGVTDSLRLHPLHREAEC